MYAALVKSKNNFSPLCIDSISFMFLASLEFVLVLLKAFKSIISCLVKGLPVNLFIPVEFFIPILEASEKL